MDPIVSKVTTTLPDSPSTDAGSQPGKVGASKFDKIRSQLNDRANGEASPAQSASAVNASTPASNPHPGRIQGNAASATPASRIRQNLTTAQYHLARLRDRVDSAQATGPMQGVMSRLTSAERQYQQLDSAVQAMPANASPQQWLALQQQVYSMNENIGALSKLVEQASSGVKSVLQTQI